MIRLLLLLLLLAPASLYAKSEADYVNQYCTGEIEHRLEDFTRVDCLTEEYAFEYDWCRKWAEAIGQSLHYARMTGKKPAIGIICYPEDQRYLHRLLPLTEMLNIHLVIIERDDGK